MSREELETSFAQLVRQVNRSEGRDLQCHVASIVLPSLPEWKACPMALTFQHGPHPWLAKEEAAESLVARDSVASLVERVAVCPGAFDPAATWVPLGVPNAKVRPRAEVAAHQLSELLDRGPGGYILVPRRQDLDLTTTQLAAFGDWSLPNSASGAEELTKEDPDTMKYWALQAYLLQNTLIGKGGGVSAMPSRVILACDLFDALRTAAAESE